MITDKYHSWPLGKVPVENQRTDLYDIKELGYDWDDPRDVIDIFEKKIAEFAGSKYCVLCDCCTHGLFLALKLLGKEGSEITIPKHTFVSVPQHIIHAGYKLKFEDLEWSGLYQLKPFNIYDSAVRWTKGMYVGNNAIQVVSFQFKKHIPIGRGGAILLDDEDTAKKLKLMTYDGRDLTLPYTHPDHVQTMGYHYYMTPEDAARGILLMDKKPEHNEDSGNSNTYIDTEKIMRNLGYV